MIDEKTIEAIAKELIVAIGYDPNDPCLHQTPRRFAAFWKEFIDYEPGRIDTVFQSMEADQMVVINGMRVWSLCEHHLLPFYCDIAIGYIPDQKVLGLSKFARIAQMYAHRLQIQERMVYQIAEHIQHLAGTASVAVVAKGEHLCQSMRGIKMPGYMKTSVMLGAFRDSAEARAEFLSMVKL